MATSVVTKLPGALDMIIELTILGHLNPFKLSSQVVLNTHSLELLSRNNGAKT
jgi:hypothetical protein